MSAIKIQFLRQNGVPVHAVGEAGMTLLKVAQEHGIELEGACEGNMACSTCHVVVEPDWFERSGSISVEEEDMLDLAAGLQPTSRLGCQIVLSQALDGLIVYVPASQNNMMGF